MKLITKDTDYALRSLCFIAGFRKGRVSVAELTAELKIPRAFLRKILQRLNKKGLLVSYKGQGGGFELARPPRRISVLEVIEIFQGRLKLQEHIFRKNPCPNIAKCPLKKRLDRIQKYIVCELKDISLAVLIAGHRGEAR